MSKWKTHYPNRAKQDYGYDNAGRFVSSTDYGAPSAGSYTKVTTILQLHTYYNSQA